MAIDALSSDRPSVGRVETWRGGVCVLRFHVPLIEPDGRVSRIRLLEKVSCSCPREAGRSRAELDQAQRLMQVRIGEPGSCPS